MPRRKFDKKNATTFSLVYRAQNDPRIHDPDASDMVFTEKSNPNLDKVKRREELENEFADHVRENEGEAAEHGIFFDDSKYDYMQHLKPIGATGEAYFVEAPTSKGKGKGKENMPLEDAIRDLDLRSNTGSRSIASSRVSSVAEDLFPGDMLPSEFVQKQSYQNQQGIPDDIAGLQPDMDPSLREVLEALEDDAYVENDEELFDKLAEEGQEIDPLKWEQSSWRDDVLFEEDEGWESDRTITAKPTKALHKEGEDSEDGVGSDEASNDNWMKEFNKFKSNTSKSKTARGNIPQDLQSSVQTGASSLAGLRRKKRKGALTANSGYSMSSSILSRTETQSVLDQRFEKLQEIYADDDFNDGASQISGMSGLSNLSKLSTASVEASVTRADFNSIMDEFIGEYSEVGRRTRRVKHLQPQSGLEQLREIREGLGPALVKTEHP